MPTKSDLTCLFRRFVGTFYMLFNELRNLCRGNFLAIRRQVNFLAVGWSPDQPTHTTEDLISVFEFVGTLLCVSETCGRRGETVGRPPHSRASQQHRV